MSLQAVRQIISHQMILVTDNERERYELSKGKFLKEDVFEDLEAFVHYTTEELADDFGARKSRIRTLLYPLHTGR